MCLESLVMNSERKNENIESFQLSGMIVALTVKVLLTNDTENDFGFGK